MDIDRLIQCTKCGGLMNEAKAMSIRFYAEFRPVEYCQKCVEAMPQEIREHARRGGEG